MRTFEDKPAVRSHVPVLVGLYGPSGSGKTMSALRLATGMQKITGGEIYVIDTESRRALHYADQFTFRHVEFHAPFSPIDYLAAIEYCASKDAKVIIVDSMSHEHEGPGGVLEMHDTEMERLSKGDPGKVERVKWLAWVKPKAERRRLINSVLQMNANFIFCFRAKEKMKLKKGEDPKELGFMPIAGEEFLFEMTVNCLLLPNSGGIPSWHPAEMGEKMMVKLPQQFKELFKVSRPLDEEIGSRLAEWSRGSSADRPTVIVSPSPSAPPPSELCAAFLSGLHRCESLAELKQAWSVVWKTRGKLHENELLQLEVAKNEMKEQLKEAANAI